MGNYEDPEYDEIDVLIDTDAIALGKRCRTAERDRDEHERHVEFWAPLAITRGEALAAIAATASEMADGVSPECSGYADQILVHIGLVAPASVPVPQGDQK